MGEGGTMKNFMMIFATVSTLILSGCYSRTLGDLEGDPTDSSTDTSEEGAGVCDDGLDNDEDGLVDCRDTNGGAEDCASDPVCADAGTDTIGDGSEDDASDVPPEDLCTDGLDNDEDGLVDCRDTNGGAEDCSDDPACMEDASEDAIEDASEDSFDAPADVPVDTSVDIPVDTGVDTSVDTGTDTSVDTGVDTTVDIPVDTSVDIGTDTSVDTGTDIGSDTVCATTPGEVTLTWVYSGYVWEELRAECWVEGTLSGSPHTLDDWKATWQDIVDWSATPPPEPSDAWARDTFTVSLTLAYAPGAVAECNFTGFDIYNSTSRIPQVYAVGRYLGSTTYEGTVTAASGTCDITSDISVLVASGGASANYVITLP